jgi:hypothetical protein
MPNQSTPQYSSLPCTSCLLLLLQVSSKQRLAASSSTMHAMAVCTLAMNGCELIIEVHKHNVTDESRHTLTILVYCVRVLAGPQNTSPSVPSRRFFCRSFSLMALLLLFSLWNCSSSSGLSTLETKSIHPVVTHCSKT